MRGKWLFLLFAATQVLTLAGCGAVSTNGISAMRSTLSGNWSAAANAVMSNMNAGMSAPMLSFIFTMSEGPMMMTSGITQAPSVSISNLNFTMGSNCFDNMANATARSKRQMVVKL